MTPPQYVLRRDHKGLSRLTYQHWCFKFLNGWLIHPHIPYASSTAPLRIADLGTGTASWPIEVAQELQKAGLEATIDAFDISTVQFPRQEWLPKNVHLHQQDAFAPFPAAFHEQFDIVQVRAFATFTRENNVGNLLENVRSLLKPGGYLQWNDLDPLQSSAKAPDPFVPIPEAERNIAFLRQPSPLVDKVMLFLPKLQELVSSHSLQVLLRDETPVTGASLAFWEPDYVLAHEEFVLSEGKLLERSDPIKNAEEAASRLVTECQAGATITWHFFCLIARKGETG